MLFLQRIGIIETQSYVESWRVAILVIAIVSGAAVVAVGLAALAVISLRGQSLGGAEGSEATSLAPEQSACAGPPELEVAG